MAFDNNERDKCATRNDAPPSYQNLLQQEANSNTQNVFPTRNLTAIQNRIYKNCTLCQCCHQDRIQHSKHI